MNRKWIIIAVLLLAGAGLISFHLLRRRAMVAEIISDEAAWDYRDSLAAATGMEVAFLQDGSIARVLREDDTAYLCGIQDTFQVSKDEVRVERWTAADGRGVVFLKEEGRRPAYALPDSTSSVVAHLISENGYVPVAYPCLGLSDTWFRIDAGGKPAYIDSRYVIWDAIDTF